MRWSGRARLPWITDSALVQLGQNATLSLWRSRVQIPYALQIKEPYRNYIKLLFLVANFWVLVFPCLVKQGGGDGWKPVLCEW